MPISHGSSMTPAARPSCGRSPTAFRDSLAQHVDLVQPTTRFGQLGTRKSTIFDIQYLGPAPEAPAPAAPVVGFVADSPAATCSGGITPACLKTLYGINYTATADGNLVSFASYLEEYARYKDLATV